MSTVTLSLRVEDAKPILRKAAYEAALYGGHADHIPRRSWGRPGPTGETFDDFRKRCAGRFVEAKRIVEAFGVEVELTTEPEAMTIHYPHRKGGKYKKHNVAGFVMRERIGGETDWSKPEPMYRSEVHRYASEAAADRVIRAWERLLSER